MVKKNRNAERPWLRDWDFIQEKNNKNRDRKDIKGKRWSNRFSWPYFIELFVARIIYGECIVSCASLKIMVLKNSHSSSPEAVLQGCEWWQLPAWPMPGWHCRLLAMNPWKLHSKCYHRQSGNFYYMCGCSSTGSPPWCRRALCSSRGLHQ